MSSSGAAESRKPKNTAFRQQRLPAWQPILTAKSVLPGFVIIGIVFIVLGVVLFMASESVQEKTLEYTDCTAANGKLCSDVIEQSNFTVSCTCLVNLTLAEKFEEPVYMYYSLRNYYQNHRRYVKSRDDDQLKGNLDTDLETDCKPYRSYNGSNIAPCGAIANSMFNDSITLKFLNTNQQVALKKTGIAWDTDKNDKFRNPADMADFKKYAKPPYWRHPVDELDPKDPNNNGFKNEDFIVWMRTAALPYFRKLYRRVSHSGNFSGGLPAGRYQLNIIYNYPVKSFEGQKYVVLTTTSWIGGKNPFIGIAYLAVGCICLLLALVFFVVYLKVGKNVDFTNIDSRTPY